MTKYATDLAAIAHSVYKIVQNSTRNQKFLLSKLLSAEPKRPLKPSSIPVSRLSRIYQFSKLSVEIGSEIAIRKSLSDHSVQKIVDALTKMRGAALKVGQMLSIQDSISPQIAEILKKVQDAADYMPEEQLDEILNSNFKDLSFVFDTFEKTPFAAASIGQVHKATLIDGTPVAVKVQYPGIRDSIDSDLNNLVMILNLGSMLPKGLYLENTIRVARLELARECNYLLEAENMVRFDKYLQGSRLDLKRYFKVPKVFKDLSNENILVTEFVDGVSIDRARVLSQDTRDQLGDRLLKLCLSELMEFRFMQTDPNFGNFLYDVEKDMINLVDFGASKEFDAKFTDTYKKLLQAGASKDRAGCVEYSKQLGFLTGLESEKMVDAHVNSLQTLAFPFSYSGEERYDFSKSGGLTSTVKQDIPVMLRERLTPPPDETYALHRKLSGFFLLCYRLKSRVACQQIFQDMVQS